MRKYNTLSPHLLQLRLTRRTTVVISQNWFCLSDGMILLENLKLYYAEKQASFFKNISPNIKSRTSFLTCASQLWYEYHRRTAKQLKMNSIERFQILLAKGIQT